MTDRERQISRAIGARLRHLRLSSGLTQGALAARLGITFQQIQKYENGGNRLSAAKVQILADLFRLPPAYFYETPAPSAPDCAALRRPYLHLLCNLQHIERHHPAAFTALCRMAASLGEREGVPR